MNRGAIFKTAWLAALLALPTLLLGACNGNAQDQQAEGMVGGSRTVAAYILEVDTGGRTVTFDEVEPVSAGDIGRVNELGLDESDFDGGAYYHNQSVQRETLSLADDAQISYYGMSGYGTNGTNGTNSSSGTKSAIRDRSNVTRAATARTVRAVRAATAIPALLTASRVRKAITTTILSPWSRELTIVNMMTGTLHRGWTAA
ncbi:MAG: hypothetical protein Q4B96_02855 [Bacillota bacterium]|nr:hypothetical protein [Bacillota bacterium]